MKAQILISLFLFNFLLACAQTNKADSEIEIETITDCDFGFDENDSTVVFADPITYPSFSIPYDSIQRFIKQNLNWNQEQNTIEGKSFVQFMVDLDGNITDVSIIKGLCDSCDSAAIEVVRKLPKMIPGKDENGQPMKTKMVMPIIFKL